MDEFVSVVNYLAEVLDQPLPLWGVFFLWALLFLQIGKVADQLSEMNRRLGGRTELDRRMKNEPRPKRLI